MNQEQCHGGKHKMLLHADAFASVETLRVQKQAQGMWCALFFQLLM